MIILNFKLEPVRLLMNVEQSEYMHMVRLSGSDIDGSLRFAFALSQMKGVNHRLALAIAKIAGIDPNIRFGYLTEQEHERVLSILTDPIQHGIPSWLVNRRKDPATGKDKHIHGSELILSLKTDVDRLKKIKSYRGIRHSLGLKSRGQRTRTTGRRGQTVGVRTRRMVSSMKSSKR